MTIEIAPIEYHKILTANEAVLYCFSLNINGKIGWRLPTTSEYYSQMPGLRSCWMQSDLSALMDSELDTVKYNCYPVRDVK